MSEISSDLPVLTAIEARVLGSLIEKKELTPDIYPLSLNALQSAANQKTSREPVMALEPGEIRHALGQLQQKNLVRQSFASRVERYEHLMAQRFSLTQAQNALVGLLLLRGPQTAHELLARSERMARLQSIEDLNTNLDLLIGRRPPLVVLLDRAPGQREERYAHLLSGPVEMLVASAAPQMVRGAAPLELEERVRALEEQVAELRAQVQALIA
jgi:uncharacterized protein